MSYADMDTERFNEYGDDRLRTTTSAVERTISGETVSGIKVTAYVEDKVNSFGTFPAYSGHWSTPGKSALNVRRLFAEEDVIPRLNALTAENTRLRAASAASWIAGRDAAAKRGYAICAETRHVALGDSVLDAIRALTPPADDKAALDAMIAEARQSGEVPLECEPSAVRYNFDGHGWIYSDQGDGSQWLERAMTYPDAEVLYSKEKPSSPSFRRIRYNATD